MSREMTPEQVRDFLSTGTRTGKLAWVGRDGRPHVTPIWFVVDGAGDELELLFNTGATTAKGRALARDPRVALVVDDERPPFAYVRISGDVELIDELDQVRAAAARIGGRYMGADRAEEFGARNGVPGELLVRLRPTKVVSEAGVAD
jgi:PPOX class probable F420-dependent enzyme